MMVVLLPEVHRPGFTVKPWLPVVDFLRERQAFWVPAAFDGKNTTAPPALENIRPGDAMATALQVGEGLKVGEASSGPNTGALCVEKRNFPGGEES